MADEILPPAVYTPAVLEESRLQLRRVLKEVDPAGTVRLEPDVELVLLHLIDDFVVRETQSAALASAHRAAGDGNGNVYNANPGNAAVLDVDDVNMALEMDHGIQLPGFPNKRQRRR